MINRTSSAALFFGRFNIRGPFWPLPAPNWMPISYSHGPKWPVFSSRIAARSCVYRLTFLTFPHW